MGCHCLLQEIFLTQGSNPCFMRWQADSLPLSHQGSSILKFKAIPRIGSYSGILVAGAPHSSTLAGKIPWMEELGGLQSMGSLRVGHDFTFTFTFPLSCIGEGNGNPLQCSCLENPRVGGAWWADVYGVTHSQT